MTIYLLVKQHAITGLKYFCKTTRKDPFKYPGSGKRWQRHLRKYGTNVTTLEYWEFEDQEACTKFALDFSQRNNIVESDEWANLIPEDGVRGGSQKGRVFSEEHRLNLSKRVISEETRKKLKENHSRPMLGKKFSKETRKLMSQNNVGFKGKSHTESTKLKVSNSLKGKTKNYSDLTCPHCGKIGKGPNMGRYHFTNCKHR